MRKPNESKVPETLTDQLRQSVKDCGVTRYDLAQQVGVSESVLSRFVSGRKGLTLATADRLAQLLGLRLEQTVSKITYRLPDESEPKPGNLNALATRIARDALDNNFSSRRGFYPLEIGRLTLLALYDNNPYAQDPGLRDRMLTQLERWCEANKLRVLGRGAAGDAQYPEYTRALIVDARTEQSRQAVGREWEAIIERLRSPRRGLRPIKGGK